MTSSPHEILVFQHTSCKAVMGEKKVSSQPYLRYSCHIIDIPYSEKGNIFYNRIEKIFLLEFITKAHFPQ